MIDGAAKVKRYGKGGRRPAVFTILFDSSLTDAAKVARDAGAKLIAHGRIREWVQSTRGPRYNVVSPEGKALTFIGPNPRTEK